MPASTTPDGIVYPLSTDPIAPLNAHFEGLADSVQDALAGTGSPYRYIGQLRYTASGTFTKATYPNLRAIRVRCVGGGGGSGGAGATTASTASVGQAGGGGAYSESFITDIASLAASVTVTVGAGGAAGAAAAGAGGAGGTSSFGSLVSAVGGGGGEGGGAVAVASLSSDPGQGGNPDIGLGDLRIAGNPGERTWVHSLAWHAGSAGGASLLSGVLARPTRANGGSRAGSAGSLYGGGANGPSNAASQPGIAGNVGAPGIVLLDLYA